jgi:hypothetical protein
LKEIKKYASSQNLKQKLKKQRFGATIMFPEGLENTPFTYNVGHTYMVLIRQ